MAARPEDMILDPLRRKYVKRTPEEEVRQWAIRLLHETCGAPMTLMASEYGFPFNGRKYRADIVIFDRNLKPLMLVECKAPEIVLDEKVVRQAARYNRVLGVKYIMATNGKTSYICKMEGDAFVALPYLPSYAQMTEEE